MDISAFRQMVEKNPKGFLGRYGLGNKILQEGGSVEEAAEHLTVAINDPHCITEQIGAIEPWFEIEIAAGGAECIISMR